MQQVNRYYQPCLTLLLIMYLAGFIGLQVPALSAFFLTLVPFNMLVSVGILLLFHTQWNYAFLACCILTFISGFLIEVAGIQTGIIFGQYEYGATLGTKLLHVPLLIGINWLILVYCAGTISFQIKAAWWIQAGVGALLMVLLDFFIEPIAVALDFWHWQEGEIPFQNYLAWFIIAYMLIGFFLQLSFRKDNRIAMPLYCIQLLFFVFHNLYSLLK
ncbi:MAG: carotenoid biosynthesis protein [Bacteroidota bacterium]